MRSEHQVFLAGVSAYISVNPEAAAYVSDFVADGLEHSRRNLLRRAADMEALVAVLVTRRHRTHNAFVRDTLAKWENRSSLEWGSTIKAMDNAINNESITK